MVSKARLCWLAELSFIKTMMMKQNELVIRGCSSVGRAPALQAGGQEFESPHLHDGNIMNGG